MIKLIVKFIGTIFDFAAFLFVLAGAIIGWQDGAASGSEFIMAVFGAFLGFIAAAVILGLPMIVLRINENLEEINKAVLKINAKIDTPTITTVDEK